MKRLSLVLIICFLAACKSPNKIPDDVIGINKMKLIVWDMMRAGSLADAQYGKDTHMLKIKTTELFRQVFAIHGISKDEFYKSYRYYEENPDKNKILMDSVTAYANRQRQELFKRMR